MTMPVKYFVPKVTETMYHRFFLLEINVVKKNEQSECLLRPQLFIPTVPVLKKTTGFTVTIFMRNAIKRVG